MFSRLFALLPAAAFVAVAVAAPNGDTTVNQCNTGGNYCCDSKIDNNSQFGGTIGGQLVGVVAQIPVTCNPISVIGIGGNSCSEQPVCCSNVGQNGLANVGCSPINAVL